MDGEEKDERSEGATGTEDITQRTSHGSIACAADQPQGISHCESPASGDVHLMAQALYCLVLCPRCDSPLASGAQLAEGTKTAQCLVCTDLEAS